MSQKYNTYTNVINNVSFGVVNSINSWTNNGMGGSAAPYGVAVGSVIAAYTGVEIKYSNFIEVFDSVYGPKGLDPQNRRYYFLLRIEGEKEYNGWYAIPDSVGRVVKVK